MLHLKTLDLRGALPPLPEHLVELNVSGNPGLTTLPAAPQGLQFLTALDCGLEGLPDFPDGSRLHWLEVSGNPQLQTLPRLPGSLTKLTAVSCGLRELPDFPARSQLEVLLVDDNHELAALPPMPRSVEHLYARNCQLQQLPELHEFSRLFMLLVSGNPLEQIPALPSHVVCIEASECRLTALPAMPDGLRAADFSNNQIRDLSQPAPRSIESLNLRGNPITELPDWVFGLSTQAEVQISVGHLSDEARQDIMVRSTSGQGPLIVFDMQDGVSQDATLGHRNQALQGAGDRPNARATAAQTSATSRTARRDTDPIREWRSWTRDPNTSNWQRQQRSIAMQRLMSFQQSEYGFLDLSQLALVGELPPLPSHVTRLNISSNLGLTLSSIPPSLKVLKASSCNLEHAPDCSEASQLESLYLEGNPRLNVLPEIPPGLENLDVSDCGLVQLPEFPGGSRLQTLHVDGNPLEQLPTLPQSLQHVSAPGCRFTELPVIPGRLWSADFSNNQIQSFSQPSPGAIHKLRHFDLRGNPINELPEWVFHLGPQAEVQISVGHMSDEVRQAMTNRVNAGTGPRIVFDLQDEGNQVQARRLGMANEAHQAFLDRQDRANQRQAQPLEVAVAAWMDQASDGQVSWRAFAGEEGAPAFANFLNRLDTTVNHVNPVTRGPFRQGVQQLLTNMAESPQLRADCFAICAGATESCQDRVTLSYQSMAVPRLAEAVRRGDFDDNRALPDFIDQARSLYRRDVLTDIANRKAARMRVVDPIEVHLAYQVKLNDALGLRLDGNQMCYLSMSGLTNTDFRAAEREVLRANRGFANHLINHSGPWAQLMQRRAPALYEQMQEAKHEAIDPQRLAPAVRAHLAQAGLQNDADASREAGRVVSDELTLHAQQPFVHQFLRDCQLDPNALLGRDERPRP